MVRSFYRWDGKEMISIVGMEKREGEKKSEQVSKKQGRNWSINDSYVYTYIQCDTV